MFDALDEVAKLHKVQNGPLQLDPTKVLRHVHFHKMPTLRSDTSIRVRIRVRAGARVRVKVRARARVRVRVGG